MTPSSSSASVIVTTACLTKQYVTVVLTERLWVAALL